MTHIDYYSDPESARKFHQTKGNGYQIKDIGPFLAHCNEEGVLVEGAGMLMTLYREFLEGRREDIILPILGNSVRDYATGTSYFYKHIITDRNWNGAVHGIDVSPAMIEQNVQECDGLIRFLDTEHHKTEVGNGIYLWKDQFNRTSIDLQPNVSLHYDPETVSYLRNHLATEDVLASNPDSVVESATGFSGPLCFYDDEDKKRIIQRVKEKTRTYISLQLKNLGAEIVAQDKNLNRALSEVVNASFGINADSIRNYLDASGIVDYVYDELQHIEPHFSREKPHHNGNFSSYLSGSEKDELFASTGLKILSRKGFVFLPAHFGNILSTYFSDTAGNPTYLSSFARRFFTIEQYFLDTIPDIGENIHLNCALDRDFSEFALDDRIDVLINSLDDSDASNNTHSVDEFQDTKISFKELDAQRNNIRLRSAGRIIFEDDASFDS